LKLLLTVISLRFILAFVWFLYIVNSNTKTAKAGMKRSEMTVKNDLAIDEIPVLSLAYASG